MKHPGSEVMKGSLEQLGLSQAEISIYQTTLNLGPRSASVIAKLVGLHRSRAYDVLQSLENRGLVERFQKNKIRYFSPKSPEKVLNLLDERKSLVEEQISSFKLALPHFLENISEQLVECEVRKFRGEREVRDVLIDLVNNSTDAIYSIGDIDLILTNSAILNSLGTEFSNLRIAKKIQLSVACAGPAKVLVESDIMRKVIFNPTIPNDTLAVFGSNKLICLSLNKTLSGTIISSNFIVRLMKSIHEAWISSALDLQ